jgi:calcineurin-like phosphoesterase family protein
MTRPAKIWVITDTHFNHQMLIDQGYRPADYQEQICRNWTRLVMPHDTVIHIGDVIMNRPSELQQILTALPGRKILVRGNHDRESDGWYHRAGFAFVAQGILIGGVWLTHAPQVTLPDGAIINLHGHLHAGNHRKGPEVDYCKLLSLEADGYGPVELDTFVGFTPMRKKILMPYEVEL